MTLAETFGGYEYHDKANGYCEEFQHRGMVEPDSGERNVFIHDVTWRYRFAGICKEEKMPASKLSKFGMGPFIRGYDQRLWIKCEKPPWYFSQLFEQHAEASFN